MAEEQTKTQQDYEHEVLNDDSLSSEEFNRARAEPDFLLELVQKRRESEVSDPGDKGGSGTGDPGDKAGAAAGDPGDKGRKRGRSGYKRSAEILTQKLEEQEAENRRLREQLDGKTPVKPEDGNKAGAKGNPAFPTGEPQDKLEEPKEDDFDSLGEFEDAMTDYRIQKGIRAELSKRDKAAKTQQVTALNKKRGEDRDAALVTQTKSAREAHDDYDDVIGQAAHVKFDNWQVDCFAMSGQFGELAYRLGQDPERAEALKKLANPIMFNQELGRISAEIQTNGDAGGAGDKDAGDPGDKGKTPRAAAPKKELPPPVGGTVTPAGGGRVLKDADYYADPSKCSPAEFQAYRAGRV